MRERKMSNQNFHSIVHIEKVAASIRPRNKTKIINLVAAGFSLRNLTLARVTKQNKKIINKYGRHRPAKFNATLAATNTKGKANDDKCNKGHSGK